jgi:hypothetical protein
MDPVWLITASSALSLSAAAMILGCVLFGSSPAKHQRHWSRNSPLTALRSAGPIRSL